MASIGEGKQRKVYVIPVMLLTTKYISYYMSVQKVRHSEIENDG